MDFQKVAEAIRKSSPEIKRLIFSVELGEKVTDIAFENNLEEEVALKLADEVGYVILDLKSRSTFFDSLTEIGVDKNVASSVAKEVESNIFSELDKIKITPPIQELPKEPPPQSTSSVEPAPRSESGVGDSFEQIILNQAKAMRVAIPPENLPVEQSEPKAIHNYVPGTDPYRETAE